MERFITTEEDFLNSNKIILRLIKDIKNMSPSSNDASRCWLELEAEINFATGILPLTHNSTLFYYNSTLHSTQHKLYLHSSPLLLFLLFNELNLTHSFSTHS